MSNLDISVVFATRDRVEQLGETLKSYEKLDDTGISWELAIVDNGSDRTAATLIETAARRLPIRAFRVAEAGQNRARNHVIDQLRGRYVVFTDDDVIPAPDMLQAYHAAFARWPSEAIFGARIQPRFPPGTPTWMTTPDFTFSTTAFARYAPAQHEQAVSRHPYGPSFAVARHAIKDRRFPENLGPQAREYPMGGEGAFLRAIAADGYRYVYVPSVVVEHVVRAEQTTTHWLLQRARNKGRGQVYLPSRKTRRRLYIGGLPLRLVLAVARSWLRFHIARQLNDEPRRVHYGIQYALRRGQLDELRRLRRLPLQ